MKNTVESTEGSFLAQATRLQEELTDIRRDLHKHPELGFEVYRSAGIVAEYLKSLGISVQAGVGRSGVVGVIEGEKSSPVVALRADLDALPIHEQNDVSYRSRCPGIMHACGHDLHTACLLGASKLLSRIKSRIPGTLKVIFQPAEETDEGASEMIADGVLYNPKVDVIFGLHNYPGLPTGRIAVKNGPLMASIDTVNITVKGVSGHGAVPDQATDAILVGCSVVMQLQSVVSRNISPLDSAVISIGTIEAGSATNIIAEKARLSGTVRTLNPDVRSTLSEHIRRVVVNTCAAFGATCEIKYQEILPHLVNDDGLADLVRRIGIDVLGEDNSVIATPTMGGEDFSLYLQHVPGCYFWLGATNDQMPGFGWHHPQFDIDERAIPIGAAILSQAALNFMLEG